MSAEDEPRLTKGEQDLLSLLAYGKTNEEIAKQLGRTVTTVGNQVTLLSHKCGVCKRRLIVFAVRWLDSQKSSSVFDLGRVL